jgi:predicted phosphodiesterase
MSIAFIHLSDIHFGQEKGADLYIHEDVRECLINDAHTVVKSYAGGKAMGVIVTGDIAYAGKREEYHQAAGWLDRLTETIGCENTEVLLVPGNHDIDWSAITSGCKLMIQSIIDHGEAQLDSFLAQELDREVLYNRFSNYRPFAEGYNCPLDKSGGYASDRTFELVPGRSLRFIGLNSALICSENDVEGTLLLGARQHVLPRNNGEELVVLSHHPLNWFRDSSDARRYVRSRARVFVSGHEHNPSLQVENIDDYQDLMLLASGATTPPKVEAGYGYTYNLLIFDWDEETDGLKVTTIPRAWSDKKTDFVAVRGSDKIVVLGCPNFRKAGQWIQVQGVPPAPPLDEIQQYGELPIEGQPTDINLPSDVMPETFPLLLLRFFRDLSPAQRLAVLVELHALPDDWSTPLTHAMERRVVDGFAHSGRLAEFEEAINKIQGKQP